MKRSLRSIGIALLGPLFAWVLIEGLSSIAYFTIRIFRDRAIAEERHTRYDPDLGWINLPNLHVPDMYGPGIDLQTNAQSFRNRQPVPVAAPPGKLRFLCSGDSFTLGYGVDNDHTWCQLLAGYDPRFEGVNMGQGGYGFDQAFLWFRRDGARLEHRLHLFAFISEDFERMRSDRFIGYGKPLLRLTAGRLVVGNVPVPRRIPVLSWAAAHRGYLGNLASVHLGEAVAGKLFPRRRVSAGDDEGKWRPVVAKVLQEMAALDRAAGSRLVLVYLPTLADYRGGDSESWRSFLEATAQPLDVPLFDLIPGLRQLPPEQVEGMFLAPEKVHYFGAAGHYTEQGNAWVAARLHERLAARSLL
jgi:hypothetical protein